MNFNGTPNGKSIQLNMYYFPEHARYVAVNKLYTQNLISIYILNKAAVELVLLHKVTDRKNKHETKKLTTVNYFYITVNQCLIHVKVHKFL